MIVESISGLIEGKNLNQEAAEAVMNEIMDGQATDAQIGSFLTALRLKGETIEEITAFAKVMRSKASTINPKVDALIDTCGTGGDKSCTINISTSVAFVLASAGIAVAKHGNRSVSSKCGSADVLEALGVKIDLPGEKVEKSIESVGIGFMFAPGFHKAMKYAIGPRREIAIRTVFNVLGPLTNPAGAQYQLVGVYDPKLCLSLCHVLKNLGAKAAMVVHGDGLDEVTTTGKTLISELTMDGSIKEYEIEPQQYGIDKVSIDKLQVSSVEESANNVKKILEGEDGPKADIVLLNAACALKIAQKVASIEEGLTLARQLVKNGKALQKLDELIKTSNA